MLELKQDGEIMFVTLNQNDIYYEVSGSGRDLILVHGNGEDHTIFNEGIEMLKDRFRCWAIDSRGHGKSSAVKEYHYADMADDLAAFMDHYDLHDVLYYGFSDGGIIGLLAAMKTDRISTLVISGANLTPSGVKPGLHMTMQIMNFLRPSPLIRMMLEEPHITKEELEQIQIPVLVLAGENDVIKQGETGQIASFLPNAKMHIIKGEGHGSYIVHSTKFVKYLIYANRYLKK